MGIGTDEAGQMFLNTRKVNKMMFFIVFDIIIYGVYSVIICDAIACCPDDSSMFAWYVAVR